MQGKPDESCAGHDTASQHQTEEEDVENTETDRQTDRQRGRRQTDRQKEREETDREGRDR